MMKAVQRSDYAPPAYWIDQVNLEFELDEPLTTVRASIQFRRNESSEESAPLVLVGEELQLEQVAIGDQVLSADEYTESDNQLVIPSVPAQFELRTVVKIDPDGNTSLSGLYRSSGNYCTQCEAMGFRRITYFLDRPDVMATYHVTITGDKAACPVMLSNGNRLSVTELDGGRHCVEWHDPYPKPSYLFALVAGNLSCHSGTFTTGSGREVRLEIWVEPQNIESCEHALLSLQQSMKWDEDVFGLEYDLDIYMIVAVNDFNMGAMENKGLNVFNSKYVLARPDSATDDDYEAVQGVIAHEYFHNWTGNRVTCRDWFQLTLKEGLTVFRDQEFTSDMTSAAVKRIADVRVLRGRQFPEDAGPMAHPIRPESYISMDNFYTATVYDKGAEIIRMYQTLLGKDGFRKGMDLYFERHDGCAVTCDDFRAAMADANQADLDQFARWYWQAGTPVLECDEAWDEATSQLTVTLTQSYPTPDYDVPGTADRQPLHMPVTVGLLDADGNELPVCLAGEDAGEDAAPTTERVLELREAEQSFTFAGLSGRPTVSLLRHFSAPVRLRSERSRAQAAFLMGHDGDSFNRWDAGQTLATELIVELTKAVAEGSSLEVDPLFVEAYGRIITDPTIDGSLKALAMALPSENTLANEMTGVDPDALHQARELVRQTLARHHRQALLDAYHAHKATGPYQNDQASIHNRRFKNACLSLLAKTNDDETTGLVAAQFDTADNMTDSQSALITLVSLDCPQREAALQTFYDRWRNDPLVLDKWFSFQALSSLPKALDDVRGLASHQDFSLANPNRVRALVGTLCAQNQVRFHDASGGGYEFLAGIVLQLDRRNPQVASRMVGLFNQWRRFETGRQEMMKAQLERIAGQEGLSKDVYEIVSRALS